MARWESGVIAKEIKCNGGKFQRGRKGNKDEKQINKNGSTELTIHGGGKELIGITVGMEHKEETGEEEQISKVGGKEQEKKPRGKEQRDKERATGEDKAVG